MSEKFERTCRKPAPAPTPRRPTQAEVDKIAKEAALKAEAKECQREKDNASENQRRCGNKATSICDGTSWGMYVWRSWQYSYSRNQCLYIEKKKCCDYSTCYVSWSGSKLRNPYC